MISVHDYEFLTGRWEGPYGAAFNVVSEDCREAGYYNGFYLRSAEPILTDKGLDAVRKFEEGE